MDGENVVQKAANVKFMGESAAHWALFFVAASAFIWIWGRTLDYLGGDSE